ncbi:MAG TPA: glycosyltransferase family 4 protein [Roseiarcus sp.]|nr:glycosyltransferase family 4 protein [Roseiarcus sp.]
MSAPRIAVVLPSRETFTLKHSGAVALCGRDFARFSRFAGRIDILGAGPCEYEDVPYKRLTDWRRWWRRDRDAYAQAVAEVTADHALIEVQNRPHMVAKLRRRLPKAKLALHLHNDPQQMQGSRTPAERARLMQTCEAVYCVSAFIRDRFLAGVADPGGKVVVIANGAPLPALAGEKAPIIAYTGRLIAAKGAAELIRAFAAADLAGWRLVLAGGDPERLLHRLAPLPEGVEWLGQVSHAQAMALLAQAEIAATPSVWDEPFARAAVEAMAHGAALIASRRGALPEVCGEAALYVEPADIADFAQALRRLAQDEGLRRGLQQAGRARAAAMFEIGGATARLDAARARLLGEA